MRESEGFVTPGEKIAIEEEFAAGEHTFVEDGVIYSAITGTVVKKDGSVKVESSGREIKLIDRDMLVIGTVSDDMKNVIFVKLDDINMGGKDYLALKDGKIVTAKPMSRFGGGGRGRDNGNFQKREKLCGVGDTILARVLYNDKDSYTLTLNSSETGVIYARCELCNTELAIGEEGFLVCKECNHREQRKISGLYNKPEEIKKLFA